MAYGFLKSIGSSHIAFLYSVWPETTCLKIARDFGSLAQAVRVKPVCFRGALDGIF